MNYIYLKSLRLRGKSTMSNNKKLDILAISSLRSTSTGWLLSWAPKILKKGRALMLIDYEYVTTVDERSLILLNIPASLLQPWKTEVLRHRTWQWPNTHILTTDTNLNFLCRSMWWCGPSCVQSMGKIKDVQILACFLLPNKRKETYIRFLTQNKTLIDVIS